MGMTQSLTVMTMMMFSYLNVCSTYLPSFLALSPGSGLWWLRTQLELLVSLSPQKPSPSWSFWAEPGLNNTKSHWPVSSPTISSLVDGPTYSFQHHQQLYTLLLSGIHSGCSLLMSRSMTPSRPSSPFLLLILISLLEINKVLFYCIILIKCLVTHHSQRIAHPKCFSFDFSDFFWISFDQILPNVWTWSCYRMALASYIIRT